MQTIIGNVLQKYPISKFLIKFLSPFLFPLCLNLTIKFVHVLSYLLYTIYGWMNGYIISIHPSLCPVLDNSVYNGTYLNGLL